MARRVAAFFVCVPGFFLKMTMGMATDITPESNSTRVRRTSEVFDEIPFVLLRNRRFEHILGIKCLL
eukprot:5586300-Karenia_brevis.AAC.1